MLTQQHHNENMIDTASKELALQSEMYLNILDSMSTGIGLLDKNYALLYCNPMFKDLLGNSKKTLLGRKIYLGRGLKLQQLKQIHRRLHETGSWRGIFPAIGKGLEARISEFISPASGSIRVFPGACNMIQLTDYSEFLYQQKESSRIKEQAEKAKSEFLSHISHELRTPITAVQGFSQLLQMDSNLSIEQKGYVKEIISASGYLIKLINEALALSKTEHEYTELKLLKEHTNIGELINECISLVKPLAQKANIQILQHESNIYLLIDRVRLKQVILNLLSNAIKYNHSGGRVIVHNISISNKSVRIEVQDSGNGIPEQLLNTVFNPFERLGVNDSQIEGSGIGLMITRRLVNIMNGKVCVVSEPGGGSVFSADFPIDTGMFDEYNTAIPKDHRSIIWVGDISRSQSFAERLTGLRPSLHFHHTESLTPAVLLYLEASPGLIFFVVEDIPSQISELSSEVINLLKKIPTIAVVTDKLSSRYKHDLNLKFTDYLSLPVIATDFMEIIDRQLY